METGSTSQNSRRAFLVGAIGGLATVIAHALGGPVPAAADTDDIALLGNENKADLTTTIKNTHSGAGESGLVVFGQAAGVFGFSENDVGVYAESDNSTGIDAHSNEGAGIDGKSLGDGQPSILGYKVADNVAVQGEIANSSSGWTAMYGVTNGSGVGVVGENMANGPGTWGKAAGTGDGVFGQSANGYGGHFKGKKAQLRLDPSGAATHPSTGLAGDIFLDSSKRLWLCKGGTSWVRIV